MKARTLFLVAAALLAAPGGVRGQAARVAFDQPAGGIAYVEASYPNTAGQTCPTKIRRPQRSRLRGRIEVVHTGNGRLSIINALSFPEYLQGLAEVPRSWPQAALEAQVIAARTYALYHLQHPRPGAAALGYDICATVACQVYRGAAVEQGAFGGRWVDAVRSTRGRVLMHDGAVIQAFYHSTSSGQTKTSFPGGTPLPYLASVSGEDADSPLSKWSVHIPFGDLAAILARAGEWPGGPVDRVTAGGGNVVVSNAQRRVTIPAARLRRVLNVEAPCVFPAKYPPARADGGRLPSTVPQSSYSLAAEPGGIAVFGRGWGHDVGMSQYGARSLAARGRSAEEILAHFYNGTRPSTVEEPGTIRVLVAEGATVVVVAPERGASISPDLVAGGDGPAYRVAAQGDDLSVTRVRPAPSDALEIGDEAILVEPGRVRQTISLAAPARVTIELSGAGGDVKKTETSYERGTHTLSVVEPGLPALAAGRYRLVVHAYDGLDRGRLEKRFDFVPAATVAAPTPAPRPAAPPPARSPAPVFAALGLAALLGLLLYRTLRRRA